MRRYILSIDLETTDLWERITGKMSENGHIRFTREAAILQIAGQVMWLDLIEGKRILQIVETFDIKTRPHEGASISDKALERNGMNREMIESFPPAKEGYKELKRILRRNLNRSQYCKWDEKFFWLGYNAQFDIKHLDQFFYRYGTKKLHDYTSFYAIDLYPKLVEACMLNMFYGSTDQSNMRLETFCARDGYPIRPHDALQDSLATTQYWINTLFDTHNEIDIVRLPDGTEYKASELPNLTEVLG